VNKPKPVDADLVVSAFPGGVPEPPEGLSERVRVWWFELFGSAAGRSFVQPSDVRALSNLAELYDMRDEAYRLGREEPMVVGGNGQVTMHPARAEVVRLQSAISSLEDRFGLTPRARQALGVQLVGATRSLEDMTLGVDD
jgi:P27 family predicted phage terminase small subunit